SAPVSRGHAADRAPGRPERLRPQRLGDGEPVLGGEPPVPERPGRPDRQRLVRGRAVAGILPIPPALPERVERALRPEPEPPPDLDRRRELRHGAGVPRVAGPPGRVLGPPRPPRVLGGPGRGLPRARP